MIQVILWDIDGTLLDFSRAERASLRACFSQFDLGDCSDERIARFSTLNLGFWKRLERGEMTKAQLLPDRKSVV